MFSHHQIDGVLQMLNYDSVALVRACSKQALNACTPAFLSDKYVQACILNMYIKSICPKPSEDWTVEAPNCASPSCNNLTGLYMPTRYDGPNLVPRVDDIHGSETVQNFMLTNTSYKYVVCSQHCRKRVSKLKMLIQEPGEVIIAVSQCRPPSSVTYCGNIRQLRQ